MHTQKLTKIVATIGPSSDSPEMISALIDKGVNIFRLNFKHNVVDWHSERVERVLDVAKKKAAVVGTLIDLQGPEIRIKMRSEGLELTRGTEVLIDTLDYIEKNNIDMALSISHPSVISHLKEGQRIIADDGAFEFVLSERNGRKYLISESEGFLKTNKTLNIPGADFPFPVLVERDYDGLGLAAKHSIDYVALSFVRSAQDIRVLRSEMKKRNIRARIVAKIETKRALDSLNEIIEETDGIMVARGDLAVEVAREQVPYWQKEIISRCIAKRKFVITATQMLLSMATKPFPTRAEVSDIANAVYDGTSALMLSEESAMGLYPDKAVEVMTRTALFNETMDRRDIRSLHKITIHDREELLCSGAYDLYLQSHTIGVPIHGIIIFTQSGRTARIMSRYRVRVPIYAFCPSVKVGNELTVEYGVIPIIENVTHVEEDVSRVSVHEGVTQLIQMGLIQEGQHYIVLHGDRWMVEGGTSTVKMITA